MDECLYFCGVLHYQAELQEVVGEEEAEDEGIESPTTPVSVETSPAETPKSPQQVWAKAKCCLGVLTQYRCWQGYRLRLCAGWWRRTFTLGREHGNKS